MIRQLINSIKRKVARRITKNYPSSISHFKLPEFGNIQFANWENPLVSPKVITENHLTFFRKFLKSGDVAVDIGANIGAMSIPLALIVGKKGAVFAFDPNPYVFEILFENSRLNPELTNMLPFNFAITEREDEFYYNSSEASFNNGGISKEPINRHGKYSLATKVKGIKLEQFFTLNYPEYLSRIKLIKIDTEGYDMEIIKSISGLLKRIRPAVISECFGKTTAQERFDHFNALQALGYSLYYFSDFDIQAEIIPIKAKEDMLKWKHFDLYAISEQLS